MTTPPDIRQTLESFLPEALAALLWRCNELGVAVPVEGRHAGVWPGPWIWMALTELEKAELAEQNQRVADD